MAQLKIYSDIVNQEEKDALQVWFGDAIDAGVTFKDIDAFVQQMADDDNKIDISLNCRGGDVAEGWAIYDKLRATGKEISTTVEGQASSMASVIMLAAPKERRSAHPHATVLIHNPYIPYAEGQLDEQALRDLTAQMEAETNKILDLYVERTGADRETLKALMAAETRMTAEQAKEYGFINNIIQPASALAGTKQSSKMSIIEKLKALIGEAEGSAADPVAMELTTATGGTLTVEREEGEPQVGDKASPDGTHQMPDGKTIIVTDGVITEIQEPAADNAEELEQLRAEVESLRKEVATLTGRAEAAEAKNAENARIVNAVRIAGGIDKVLASVKSNGAPEGRTVHGKVGDPVDVKANVLKEKTYALINKKK